MKRWVCIALVLLLAGCASVRKDVDRYNQFLTFVEGFAREVYVEGCCDLETVQQIYAHAYQRRIHMVAESEGANYAKRFTELRNVLWVWLGDLRDSGKMTSEQYRFFANKLMAWR